MLIQYKRKYSLIIISIVTFLLFAIIINLLKYSKLEINSYKAVLNPIYHFAIFLETEFGLSNSRSGTAATSPRYSIVDLGKNFTKAVYQKNFPTKLEEIKLNIKFKHWKKILEDRNKAMVVGINKNAQWVPSIIEIGKKNLKGKVRLKGNTADHWFWPKRWSLRIELNGKHTFQGMKEFSLQRVGSRQFPADYLFQTWHRYLGGLAPRFNFVKVNINGDNWGIMMMEEGLSKHFLEHAKRKDSPLVKLISTASEGGYFFTANRLYEGRFAPSVFYSKMNNYKPVLMSKKQMVKNSLQIDRYSYLKNALYDLHKGEIDSRTIFNIKSLILPCILANVWGTSHTLASQNTRYYFNPYSLLIEPITSDQTRMEMINKFENLNCPFPFSEAFKDNVFQKEIDKTLEVIETSIPKLKIWHNEVCKYFPIDCPKFDDKIIKNNFKKLKIFLNLKNDLFVNKTNNEQSFITKAKPTIKDNFIDYPEHVYAEHFNNGDLVIYNYLSKNVNIEEINLICNEKIRIKCQNLALLDKPVILKKSPSKFTNLSKFILQTNIKFISSKFFIEIITSRNNVFKRRFLYITTKLNTKNPFKENKNYFLKLIKSGIIELRNENARFKQGNFIINKPLVIPEGINLILSPGTTLIFTKNSYILLRGSLIAKGLKDSPIVFKAKNQMWQGIHVINSLKKSYLENVLFENISTIKDIPLILTSGVTFYKSNIEMLDVTFNRSHEEDALNIIESNFLLNNMKFQDTISDSLDIDFSIGKVENSTFQKIGGDAIDLSGSKVKIKKIRCNYIKDKCLSVGEKSVLSADKVFSERSGTAVATKDGSYSKIIDLFVRNNKGISAMVYNKKSGYGKSTLILRNTNIKSSDSLTSKENYLEINNNVIRPKFVNVEKLYSNEQMKKFRK